MNEIRVGIIGFSEGNGHPFSFSAIINGYDDKAMAEAGWPVIHGYLQKKSPEDFGIEGVQVTCAWTQDFELTQKITRACKIKKACKNLNEFDGEVDAVVIARDDFESHFELALPFLKKGLPVFVDKPLSLHIKELRELTPYLKTGQLMSCAALRYATELDGIRESLPRIGPLKLLRGTVLLSWEKYGIHMLDGLFGLGHVGRNTESSTDWWNFHGQSLKPKWIQATPGPVDLFTIGTESDALVQISCLGAVPKTFEIGVWGAQGRMNAEVNDNFAMFKRMLEAFFKSIRNNKSAIDASMTLTLMRVLIGGRMSQLEKRAINLEEVVL